MDVSTGPNSAQRVYARFASPPVFDDHDLFDVAASEAQDAVAGRLGRPAGRWRPTGPTMSLGHLATSSWENTGEDALNCSQQSPEHIKHGRSSSVSGISARGRSTSGRRLRTVQWSGYVMSNRNDPERRPIGLN